MSDREKNAERIPFTCTLDCGSRCELVASIEGGRAVRLDTPPNRPDTDNRPRLVPCVRGRAQRRVMEVPEKLHVPLVQVGMNSGRYQQIAWDEALDEVAGRLAETRTRSGSLAVLHATGAGSISGRGFSGSLASRRFFSFFGPVTETSGNQSYHCAEVAAQWMLGGVVPGCDRATLLDSRLIVLWGMNPAETWMGPNTGHFIAGARDRGARVILIDPRYTDSGILADQWIPVRPGTDAALAAALAYVIECEGLVDQQFMASCTRGYEPYRAWLLGQADGVPKTPDWASPITGVSAEAARQLAYDIATSKPMALLPGWGPQRTAYGEQIARAWITLACLTGNVGVRGGGLASIGTRSGSMALRPLPQGPYRAARVVSASTWAAPILSHTLHPPIRMAYVVASNLINRSPDARANALALDQLEFVVVNEQFLTPTARRADIILPICTDMERSDLVTSWGHDSHLFYSRQAVPSEGQARTDYWVFAQLAERLGFGHEYTCGRTEEEWLGYVLGTEALDRETLCRHGILRTDGSPRVALSEFRADPTAHPLPTRSGLIEIANLQASAYGLPVIPSYIPDDASRADGYPLQLVTPHSKLRSNSCGHANPWLRRLEPHAVWISRVDADARGIAEGDLVYVSSPSGTIAIESRITERIMPGVVCVYQGTWYEPDEEHVDRGGCANTLTSQRLSPSGGPTTHSTWVEVSKSL